MNINVQYQGMDPGIERQLLRPDHGWADFDTILADENYRALKKITLILGIEFAWWFPTPRSTLTEEGVKPRIAKLFPKLKGSGRVKMEILVNLS